MCNFLYEPQLGGESISITNGCAQLMGSVPRGGFWDSGHCHRALENILNSLVASKFKKIILILILRLIYLSLV